MDLAVDCLFNEYLSIDLDVSPSDDTRLLEIARDLHSRREAFASGHYFAVLQTAVEEEYANDLVSMFRLRELTNRLNRYFIEGEATS